ncbi:unnamed protein product [Cuscuta epithymum]|uniref:MADS-box domain-containing protein n=1 Tax=Cuscuta epithymum TaxID=186058 RepID=A0AAV0D019_9ASTE|nr:unnamed protein product [Cuscuta epithymum]
MGKGKAKIEMKKIESLQARNTCFSKRRKGLFKKSEELCRLFPGSQVVVAVLSPAGKAYITGDPNAVFPLLQGEEGQGGVSSLGSYSHHEINGWVNDPSPEGEEEEEDEEEEEEEVMNEVYNFNHWKDDEDNVEALAKNLFSYYPY